MTKSSDLAWAIQQDLSQTLPTKKEKKLKQMYLPKENFQKLPILDLNTPFLLLLLETGSCYVVQAGLELMILLLPKCWIADVYHYTWIDSNYKTHYKTWKGTLLSPAPYISGDK
jgi:hypothetical protein